MKICERRKVCGSKERRGKAMQITWIGTKMLRIERKSLAWELEESNRCRGRGEALKRKCFGSL